MRKLYFLIVCLLPLTACSQGNKKDTVQTETPVLRHEDVYTTLKFEVDGKPAIAVIGNQFKDTKVKSQFSLSLFITVNTVDKDANGHPTPEEAAFFHTLQTKIIESLAAGLPYCHVGTTTLPGSRDIMLYIEPKNQEKAAGVLNKLKKENTRLVSYTFESDPEWEAVASFYEAVPKRN